MKTAGGRWWIIFQFWKWWIFNTKCLIFSCRIGGVWFKIQKSILMLFFDYGFIRIVLFYGKLQFVENLYKNILILCLYKFAWKRWWSNKINFFRGHVKFNKRTIQTWLNSWSCFFLKVIFAFSFNLFFVSIKIKKSKKIKSSFFFFVSYEKFQLMLRWWMIFGALPHFYAAGILFFKWVRNNFQLSG